MSAKIDQSFEAVTNDPVRRRAAIVAYSRKRIVMFVCAVLVTVCALELSHNPARNPHSLDLARIGAILLWVVVFRISTHLRMLHEFDHDLPAKAVAPKP